MIRQATQGVAALAAVMLVSLPARAPAQWLDLPGPASASQPAGAGEKFTVRPILSARQVRAGDSLHVALEMTVAPGFWTYGPVPGGRIPVKPLVVSASHARLEVGEALFPPPRRHVSEVGGATDAYYVYEGTFYVYLPVRAPPDAPAGRYDLTVHVEAQVCDPQTCLLPAMEVPVTVEVGAETAVSVDWTGRVPDGLASARNRADWVESARMVAPVERPGADLPVWTALGLALLAGLILNIMPCVLPVIPLKVLSIVEQARESPRRFVTLGLAFAAGIVLFFVALAGLNAVLRLAFAYTFQWGEHFRQPAFIVAMSLLLVALAMNLFGAFTVTVPGRVAAARTGEGVAGAVGMGVLTAVLSTPCSFAILTFAFAWAQTQPLWLGTVGIVLIGAGMAGPYAVLTAFPRLVARVPRSGRWTELFKQSMGFVLLLVAVWLLSTQSADKYPFRVAGYAVVLSACLWAWGSWVRYDGPRLHRWLVRGGAAAVAVAAGWWLLSPPRPLAVRFEPFDAARIVQARAEGRTVLVDFTADWCLTCKTVEKLVYDDREVARALRERNVLVMKGDVTTRDRPAVAMLRDLNEPGVPVTVLFPPGHAPIRLRGVFTKGDLLRSLERPDPRP